MGKRHVPSLWLVRKLGLACDFEVFKLCICVLKYYWSMKKLNYLWGWNMDWNSLTLKLVPRIESLGCFFPVLTVKAENQAGELRVNAYSYSTVILQCDTKQESSYMHTQLAALYTVIIYNRVHVWGKSCTSSEHCPRGGHGRRARRSTQCL